MRKIALIFVLLLFTNLGYSQLSFSERVKYSNSASSNDKSLFLVDFWATWCAPCIHVSKYLNVLQQEFPEDMYIVSLSYESKPLVRSFLEKHPTELAVSVDDNKKNFDGFGIEALPYGILFNAYGDIVWKGNPADLKNYMVSRFLKKNKKKISISDFIKYNQASVDKELIRSANIFTTTKNYEFFISDDYYNKTECSITKKDNYTIVEGSMTQVVGYLMKLNKKQLKSIVNDSQTITVLLKDGQGEVSENVIAEKILRSEGYTLARDLERGSVFKVSFPTSDELFWNSNQIDWGRDKRPAFMVSDDEVIGDNISVETIMYKLSNLVFKPFVVNAKSFTNKVYDWNIHFKYKDLMISNFENYGIKLSEEIMEYPIYTIKKRGSK